MVRQLIFLFYIRTSVLLIAYYLFLRNKSYPIIYYYWYGTFLYILQFCPKVFNYTDVEVQCWGNYWVQTDSVSIHRSSFSCISFSILAFNLSLHLSVVPLGWENFEWLLTVPNVPIFGWEMWYVKPFSRFAVIIICWLNCYFLSFVAKSEELFTVTTKPQLILTILQLRHA